MPAWTKAFIFAVTAAKIWLVQAQTLFAIGFNNHDDYLFMTLASHLLAGNWLGPYNNLTLAKGPFFPLWIAFSFASGIPLLLSYHLLYIAACLLFVLALRPLFSSPWLAVILYSVLLMNPISYTDFTMTRAAREGIYPALTILVFATGIGLLSGTCGGERRRLWAVGLGVSLAAFWLTREEGIWILPSLFLMLAVAAAKTWREHPGKRLSVLFTYLLPLMIWLVSIAGIATINWLNYRVFTIMEMQSEDFVAAYGALSRVKPVRWIPYVPVPKDTRSRIYKVSDTFAELEPFLEGDIGTTWSQAGWAGDDKEKGSDMRGGWFMWALRDAVAAAGHYRTALAAKKYYRRLADEINRACEEGKLHCGGERANLRPPWRTEYFRPLWMTSIHTLAFLARFDEFNPYSSFSVGSKDRLTFFRDLAQERLSPAIPDSVSDGGLITVTGWAFHPEKPVTLAVSRVDGRISTPSDWFPYVLDSAVTRFPSPDVHRSFLSIGQDFENARQARFRVAAPCRIGCSLEVRLDRQSVTRIPLRYGARAEHDPSVFNPWGIYYHIDSIRYGSPAANYRVMLDELKTRSLRAVGLGYRKLVPVLSGLAVMAYLVITAYALSRRRGVTAWIISSSLLLGVFVRVLLVSLIDVTSFASINTWYLSPAYPLFLAFIVLTLFSFWDLAKTAISVHVKRRRSARIET